MDPAPREKNHHALAVRSENPCTEVSFEECAREVATLEYYGIEWKHPQIKTMVQYNFSESFLDACRGLFDAAFTYSSLEHTEGGEMAIDQIQGVI